MTVPHVSEPQDTSTAPAIRRSAERIWLAIAILAAVYVLLRVNAIGIPLDRDEGAFGYGGQRVLDGGLPYRDVVDHKPPGVFYIYAIALRFVPATPAGIHIFLHLYNAVTLIALWGLMRARFGTGGAPFWGAFCYAIISASPALQGFTASTEMFMLLPIVLCVWLAVEGVNRRGTIWLVLSGACAAMAFWIKPTGFASCAFALLYLAFSDGPIRIRIQRALLWLGGVATASAILVGYYASHGLLAALFYWTFSHNLAYAAQISTAQALRLWLPRMAAVLSGQLVAVGAGLTLAAWKLNRRTADSLFVLGFLGCSVIGTLPGVPYAHYFAQLAPAIAVAAGWALARIADNGTFARRWIAPGLAACILAMPLVVHRNYFFETNPDVISLEVFGQNPFREAAELGRFLADQTTESDRTFIFGSEPEILLQARRLSATPFVMIYPLTREYARYREFQESVWQDVQRSEPTYIVIVDLPNSGLWDGKAELRILANVQELIGARYELQALLPVRVEKQRLLVFAKDQAPDPAIVNSPYNIYVYRRRTGVTP